MLRNAEVFRPNPNERLILERANESNSCPSRRITFTLHELDELSVALRLRMIRKACADMDAAESALIKIYKGAKAIARKIDAEKH